MNDNRLEEHLSNLHFEVTDSLLNEMVNTTMQSYSIKLIPLKWLAIGLAASITLFGLVVYWQTGSLNYNSLLGLEGLTSDELNNYILYL